MYYIISKYQTMYNDHSYDYAFDNMSDEISGIYENHNEFLELINNHDKNRDTHSIPFRKIAPDGKWKKRLTIVSYGSGGIGSKIRNAVTGSSYNFLVGSSDEDLFFKVIDSTGRNKRRDPLMLYYDTPEQYENHRFTKVSVESKSRWNKKFLEAQERLNVM